MRRRVTDFAMEPGVGILEDGCLQKGGKRWTRRLHQAFRDLDDGLVGNLPAEGFHLLPLSEVFLEEDGLAGIGRERTRRGQQHAPRAIVHLDPAAEQTGILSHVTSL